MAKATPLNLKSTMAKPTDYKKVARLCIRSVPPRGGYVLPILLDVIKAGGLFLAWEGNGLVGMTNFEQCLDGSGWLSMARTDPDWRGQGVAGFLQNQVGAYSRRKGINVLRLLVASKNTQSIRAIQKGRFKPICEAAHLSRNLRPPAKRIPKTDSKTLPKISLRTFLASRHVAKMNGHVPYGWQVIKVNQATIERLRRRGDLYFSSGCWFILTRPEKDGGEVESEFSFIDGRLSQSFQVVLECARQQGVSYLSGYVPYGAQELSIARRFGFKASKWGRHCLVFERQLR